MSTSRSSRTKFAGAPTATRGRSSPKIRAGPADIRSSSVSSRTQARLDEVRVERRERRLQAGHAERRRLERHVLLLARVRRVVGRDRRDRAVVQRVDQRRTVVAGPERRVHLQVRVERPHRLVGEAEVVRRHLAARRHARAPATAAAARPTRAPTGA